VRSRAPEALDLPAAPNTWSTRGDADALWLGPDEWLLVGTVETEGLAAADATVDVSAKRVLLELIGSERLELLAASCGLDLDPRVWQPGGCAQTLVGRIPVLLQEREGATRVFVRPSFARALVDWLVATAP
jgi:sarcosine oxidase subunit gamma